MMRFWHDVCLWRTLMRIRFVAMHLSMTLGAFLSDLFLRSNMDAAEGYGDEEDRDEYLADSIFYVPQDARWSEIQSHTTSTDIGKVIDHAMDAIGGIIIWRKKETEITIRSSAAEYLTFKKYLTVQSEGTRQISRNLDHYNLQMIIAVGFKVNNQRAVQFRKWAGQIVKDYTIQGWTMDKERLKNGHMFTDEYFDRQLQYIREIRLSERKFYQKVTDLYATAFDYQVIKS